MDRWTQVDKRYGLEPWRGRHQNNKKKKSKEIFDFYLQPHAGALIQKIKDVGWKPAMYGTSYPNLIAF